MRNWDSLKHVAVYDQTGPVDTFGVDYRSTTEDVLDAAKERGFSPTRCYEKGTNKPMFDWAFVLFCLD